jgi:hypothetical protein
MARIVQALDTRQIVNTDYDGGAKPIYVGYASPGSSDSDSAWLIIKYTYDEFSNPTKTRFAGGVAKPDKVWNDRAGYVYS